MEETFSSLLEFQFEVEHCRIPSKGFNGLKAKCRSEMWHLSCYTIVKLFPLQRERNSFAVTFLSSSSRIISERSIFPLPLVSSFLLVINAKESK